jgi:nucleoside 2-deoxyribosyltransferase
MDGADPDSGTAWECGYAYAKGKPVVLFRSDLRVSGDAPDIPYNAMLVGAASVHIELPLATLDDAARAILRALRTLPGEERPRTVPAPSAA